MKKYFFLLLLVVNIFNLNAQNFYSEMRAILERNASKKPLSIVAHTRLYKLNSDESAAQTLISKYERIGDSIRISYDSVEWIYTPKAELIINHKKKTIVYTPRITPNIVDWNAMLLPDSVYKQLSKKARLLDSTKSVHHWVVDYSDVKIQQLEYFISPPDWMAKQVIHFKVYDNVPYQKQVMTFERGDKPKSFSLNTYLKKEGKNAQLQEGFMMYDLRTLPSK